MTQELDSDLAYFNEFKYIVPDNDNYKKQGIRRHIFEIILYF